MLLIFNPGTTMNILFLAFKNKVKKNEVVEAAKSDLYSTNSIKSHHWFQYIYCMDSRECFRPGVFVAAKNKGMRNE